ncbi:Uma2 family endonuclease [bacterium]|nr:MAG: Uma2 family endonuclease [bacterium]
MAPAVLEKPIQMWTFERFLEEGPEKAELVDGELFEMAGVSERHDRIQYMTRTALEIFCERTAFGVVRGEIFAMSIDDRSAPMPDIHVYSASRQSQLHERYAEAPADLAIEIVSPSNRGVDFGRKLELYERVGVREFWFVDPERRTGTYYRMTEAGMFQGFRVNAEGRVASIAVPGFEIPEVWLFDPPTLVEILTLQS